MSAPANGTSGHGWSSEQRSTGELIAAFTEQTGTLIRQEMRLVQAELQHKAKDVGVGAGLFGTAGVLALYGVGALIATVIAALSLLLPVWAAAGIVTLVLFAAAGVAALVGKNKVSDGLPPAPEQTIDNIKDDIATIKGERS